MKLTKVKLYGALGDKYGKEFDLSVFSVGEAVRALYTNFPALKKEIYDGKFHVLVENGNIEEKDLLNPTGHQTIKLIPVVSGAGKGFFKIILGAALIGASIYLGGIPGSFAGALSPGLGTTLFTSALRTVGTSLLFGGISELLFSPADPVTTEPQESTPNFAFSGVVNTTGQGAAVPVCYGRLIVGSAVISAGISTDRV